MSRRAVPTSAAHAAALDRVRARYGKGPTSAPTTPRTGRVIVFHDGCSSWFHYPHGFGDLDAELVRLVADPVVGPAWDGSHIVDYERPDPRGPMFDVDLGVALPSYQSCPRHREGGTERTNLTEESTR